MLSTLVTPIVIPLLPIFLKENPQYMAWAMDTMSRAAS